MVVTVSAALGGLEIVRLGGLDSAESRAAALHIDNQGRQISAGDVGDTLLLQGNSGAGGGSHYAFSCAGNAIHHVNGGNFTFCLQKHTADLRHTLGHVGSQLRLGGDGISKIMAATCLNGSLGNGFIALHQNFFSHKATLTFLR